MSTSKRRTFTEKKAGYPKPKRQTPARGILAQWHRLRDHGSPSLLSNPYPQLTPLPPAIDEIPEGVFNDCDLVVSAGAETRTGAFSAMSRGGRAEDGNDPFAKLVKKNTDAPAVAQSISKYRPTTHETITQLI